ncbi:MAG: RidA family protein [Candidatus Marinimicrobia bacterium]|nr:RidA family protein [Candidatus Neomarinimicrobiota bacterium]MCK4447848.1 RidA family protein [Candidatus Neomarinimicrobiota bacterium]
MNREIVNTDLAPKAIGPYSQAVISNGFVYTAGQIPINPKTGKIEASDLEGQVRQVLDNLSAVLEASDSSLKEIIKLTVFMVDLNDFAILNNVFKEYFPEDPPARSAVQVSRLPKDVLVEIEAVAVVHD